MISSKEKTQEEVGRTFSYIFRVAFRLGEMRGKLRGSHLATNEEIDREASFHVPDLIRQAPKIGYVLTALSQNKEIIVGHQ